MESWAQYNSPLFALPGKWWHDFCGWKPSSEVGKHYPSRLVQCEALLINHRHVLLEKHFIFSDFKTFSGSRGYNFAIYIQTWIVEIRSWVFCFSCLFAYLLILKKNRCGYFLRKKERTLISFFTRDFSVEINFMNLSNKLCLVWWWGNNPLHLWITAEEHTNTIIILEFLIKVLLPSTQFLDSRFLHSQLTPPPASQKVHCWQVLSIHVLVLSMSNVVTLKNAAFLRRWWK